MKKITLINLATFLVLLFSTMVGYGQVIADGTPSLSPACSSGCTSSAVEIGKVFLGDALGNQISDCTSGDLLTGIYIWVQVTKASSKDNLYLQFNLFKDNVKIGIDGLPDNSTDKISIGDTGVILVDNYRMFELPNYFCGEALDIRNIYISWQTPNSNVPPGCATQDPQCSGALLNSTIVVITPIVANFSAVTFCTGGTYEQVVYTSTVTGGSPNNSYNWNFGAGASPATANTIGPHTVTYSSEGSKTVTLIVTDQDNITNTDTKIQTVTVAACCTAAINSIGSTNVQCYGNSDGTVTATEIGGVGTITYDLLFSSTSGGTFVATGLPTDGDSDGSYTSLDVGFYKVVVTEANGCSDTSSEVEITQPSAALTSSISSQTNVDCFGNNNGSVTVAGANGTSPYTYAIDGITFGSSGTFSSLIAGSYTITVKDANGCTKTQAVTITQPSAALTSSISSQTNVDCFGNNNGSVTVAGANGTSPYTYAIDGITFGPSGTFSSLIAGSYTITVKDANGCTTTQGVTITQPAAALTASATGESLYCAGDADGNITLIVSGGTVTYTYSWKKTGDNVTVVSTDQNPSNLTAGTYNVTVTDANGCTATASATIIDGDGTAPVVTAPADYTVEGCSLDGFTYNGWAYSENEVDITATYTGIVNATDGGGTGVVSVTYQDSSSGTCPMVVTRTFRAYDDCGNVGTDTQVISINDTTPPVLTIPVNAGIECTADISPGALGTATATDNCDGSLTPTYTDGDCFGLENQKEVNAGTGIYQYFNISGMAGLGVNSIKDFTLTFETNQGKGRAEFILVAPNGKGIVLVGPYCEGGNCDDGDGGVEVYSPTFYPSTSAHAAWINSNFIAEGSGNFEPNGGATTNTVTGLTNGLVSSFEALTAGMTSLDGQWFVYSKKQENVNGNVRFISSCLTPALSASCANNDVTIREWTVTDACGNTSTGNQVIVISDTTAPVATGSITATNIEGCTIEDAPDAVTTVAALEALTGNLSISDNCSADANLTVSSSDAVNGTCPIVITRTYKVIDECSNESLDIIHIININDTIDPTGTVPADITDLKDITDVPVADIEAILDEADNCSSVTVTVNDTNNEASGCSEDAYVVTRTYTLTDACGNDIDLVQTITVEADAVTVDDPTDVTECESYTLPALINGAYFGTTGGVNPIAVGTVITETTTIYVYAVSADNDNCTDENSFLVTINVLPVVPSASNQSECEASPIQTLTASATVPTGFSVVWYDAATEGNVVENPTLNTVGSITYYAESVNDVTECTSNSRTAVSLEILAAPVAPISGGDQIECATSPIQTLTATATVPEGFSVVWYDAVTGGEVVTSPTLNAVGSVTYYAESVNNNTECTSNSRTAVTLTINATPAAPISGGNLTVCSDGTTTQTLTATATGGTITWYTSATGGSVVTSPTQVGVGTSTYYAQSSNGICSSLTRTAVTLTINATPVAPISGGNLTVCSDGTTTQTLTATATGGTITWYTSATGGSVVTSPTQVGVGSVTYYAESSNGTCSSLTRTAVTLTINATPVAPISGGNLTVCSDGTTTQTLTATATGGTITWYTAATGGSLVTSPTQVGVGTSTYYAQSSNGTCSSLTRTVVTLTINATPEVTISGNSVLTCVNESITLTAIATVQGSASYLWNTGATTATIEVTASGEYSVTVTDGSSGCSAMETVTVTGDATPPAANISGNGVLTCATQSITLTASATVQGTASYLWNTGATTATIMVTASGEYSVVVLDSDNGCSATATVTVAQDIAPPTVNISGASELNCTATSIILNAAGSTVQGTASYLWNTGATTASIEVNQAGDYTVVVTDSDNGCSNALTKTVTENYVAAEITGGSIALCIEDASSDITTLLPSNFISGGTWTDDMNSGGLTGNMFDPSTVNLGDYEFTYTEPGDCGRIISVSVNVNDDCVVLACSTPEDISKVVTPNGDGVNDVFSVGVVSGGNTCKYIVKIFSRWGKMVYHSDNYLNNWNGKHDGSGMSIGSNLELPTGTYYYIVNIIDTGGSSLKPITGYIYLGTH